MKTPDTDHSQVKPGLRQLCNNAVLICVLHPLQLFPENHFHHSNHCTKNKDIPYQENAIHIQQLRMGMESYHP